MPGSEPLRSRDTGRFRLGDVRLQRSSEVSIPSGAATGSVAPHGAGPRGPAAVGATDLLSAAQRGEHWLLAALRAPPLAGCRSARFKQRWSFEHKRSVRYDLTAVRSGRGIPEAARSQPEGELELEWCGQALPEMRGMGGPAAQRAGAVLRMPRGSPGRASAEAALGRAEVALLALARRKGRGMAMKALDCVGMVARARMGLLASGKGGAAGGAPAGGDKARARVSRASSSGPPAAGAPPELARLKATSAARAT